MLEPNFVHRVLWRSFEGEEGWGQSWLWELQRRAKMREPYARPAQVQKGCTRPRAREGEYCTSYLLSEYEVLAPFGSEACTHNTSQFLRVRLSAQGWGLKTAEKIYKGDVVQEYVGEIVDSADKEKRLKEWTEEHPNDPNFYIMVCLQSPVPHWLVQFLLESSFRSPLGFVFVLIPQELSQGWYIDARHTANLSRFINHSCDPNCDLHRITVGGYTRNGIFANRDIEVGEFLSYDYQFDTKLDRFVCRCGAKKCRGNMRGTNLNSSAAEAKKSNKEIWEEAKRKYELDKKFVSEHYEEEETQRSQVAATVPCAENSTETVSMGVQARYRDEAIRGRLFLWRNAVRGSDFLSKVSRLENRGDI